VIDQIAAKLDAEAPSKAIELGRQQLQEYFVGDQSVAAGDGVIQRQTAKTQESRSTASLAEVWKGYSDAITDAWGKLNIRQMLWEGFKTLFWPPATIEAIGHEFSELWSTDWAKAASSLFAPRNILEEPAGFFHDVWSNILILVDFPLALWRRLNSILMLLLPILTVVLAIILALVGGFVGGALTGGVAGIPGALAGAGVALAIAETAGLVLLASYVAAESLTIEKSLVDLFTARQTAAEKKRDYVQIAGSLLGMAVAAVLVTILALISELVGAIVRAVKVGRAGGKVEVKPAEVKPAEVKPAEVKPAEVKPAEVKPAEVKPAEVKPAEVKPAEVKPAEVKPAEAEPAEVKPTEVEPARPAAEEPVGRVAKLENEFIKVQSQLEKLRARIKAKEAELRAASEEQVTAKQARTPKQRAQALQKATKKVGRIDKQLTELRNEQYRLQAKSDKIAMDIAEATGPKIKPGNIKSGAKGGPTEGKDFPDSVKKQARAEDPTKTCVYCGREGTAAHVDHAIPKTRGGNATLQNAQLTCWWCNLSKGNRPFPVNPPPGYTGPWPPPWWQR
jgi:hypothetical protein